MTRRDLCELCNKRKRFFVPVSEASVDEKLTGLQNIKLTANDSVMEYSNEFQGLAKELQAAGHQISER